MELKDFDTILESIGSYGPYQHRMMFFVVSMTSLIIGLQVSTRIFITIVPDHWCHVEGRESSSMSVDEWKNFTIPISSDGSKFEKCEHYVIYWENDYTPYRSNETMSCTSWEYDRSLLHETLATTNDWVCDRELYSVHIMSANIAGSCISTFIMPYLADKYTGRRQMYLVSIFFHFIFEFAAIFTSNFPLHLVWRFLASCSFQTNYQMSYIISLELIAPGKRALAETLSFAAWTVGMCLTSLLAWAAGDWRYISTVSLLLDSYMFAVYWMMPESPRWLLSKNRTPEATKILMKIAEVNKVTGASAEDLQQQLTAIEKQQPAAITFAEIRRYPTFFRTVILLCCISAASYVVYGVISLDVNFIDNSYFMNFFLLSLMEFPSQVTGWLGVQYLGRRLSAVLTYLLCAGTCCVAALVGHDKTALLVVVSLLKWLSTSALFGLYLQVSELYPTTMRSTGMGAIAVFGTAFFSATPYIINADEGSGFKYLMLMGLSAACAVLSIPLPETLSMPLPQTLAEADSIASVRPLKKLIHHWNVKKFTPVPFYGQTCSNDKQVTRAEESAVQELARLKEDQE
ncbi:solute carrier family 22 member 5-like [Hyalella azteca]|uniref:Solute carrier family 22 member 5-like n=1 Tax=Hyalella azteca TaxID=294128 RepID=A0A8B7PM90_HYAAZ|nr:solute carrier family 22 member 5-like [Hyalella azteca]